MDNNFKGKRILVTGGCQGIGRGIVLELWRQGAAIVTLSNQPDKLEELKKEYPSIEVINVDLRDWNKTSQVIESLGVFDGLVNNAGIALIESFLDCTQLSLDEPHRLFVIHKNSSCFRVDDNGKSNDIPVLESDPGSLYQWSHQLPLVHRVNVKAIVNVSQIVVRKMIENKIKGAIVNISSQASKAALKDHVVYCASKGAVDSMTRVMALELGPHGIRVNSINPTVILTEMGRKVWSDPAKSGTMLSNIPLGRFGEVNEVVNAVLFLLSDDASMISGVQLPVDGGFLAT